MVRTRLLLRDNFSLACGAEPPSKTTGWAPSILPKFPRPCSSTGRHIRRQGNSAFSSIHQLQALKPFRVRSASRGLRW